MNQKVYKWCILDDIKEGYLSIYLQFQSESDENEENYQTVIAFDPLSIISKNIELIIYKNKFEKTIYSVLGQAYFDYTEKQYKIIVDYLTELNDFNVELHKFTYDKIKQLQNRQ